MLSQDTLHPITEAQRTAYARQLRAGFSALRFEPTLEAGFLKELDRDLEPRLTALALLLLLIWIGFCATDLVRVDAAALSPQQHPLWLELLLSRALVLGVLMALAVMAWTHTQTRHHRAWTWVGALVITLGATWGTSCYLRMGGSYMIEALILLVAGLFLPIGLTLRQTVPLALICLLTIVGTGLLLLDGVALKAYLTSCALMPPAAAMAAFGAYHREYAQRQQFLLRAELGWQANHDALTSLSNRRLFDERLDILARQSRRDGKALALLLVDVDHFKLYNDQYGHPAGDEALRAVAEVLQSVATRPLDLAARLGGEEMALLFYGADADAAQQLGHEALERLRRMALPHPSSNKGFLSMSLGGSLLRTEEDPEALYRRADRLLYEAKKGGRDQLAFAP